MTVRLALICNKKLDDNKNPRQFRVRLVMETAGGILVMRQADDVFELSKYL